MKLEPRVVKMPRDPWLAALFLVLSLFFGVTAATLTKHITPKIMSTEESFVLLTLAIVHGVLSFLFLLAIARLGGRLQLTSRRNQPAHR